MKYTLTLLLCSFFSLQAQEKSRWITNVEMKHDGILRYFNVFIPLSLNKNPELVIQLHGGTQSKEDLYDSNAGASKYWATVAEKNNFLLIVPNGIDTKTGNTKEGKLNWNDCRNHPKEIHADDVGFISDLIDWSISNYNVNAKKVFVTGVSNGGLMSYRLALEIPQKITAIAAFNANFFKDSECKNGKFPIPVMIVNGTHDKFIPFNGGQTKYLNETALSSQETVDFWLKNNDLDPKSFLVTSISDVNTKDKSTIKTYYYKDIKLNNDVYYCIVNGGGHTMPGKKYILPKIAQLIVGKQNQDVEGAELAWDFFKRISK